jgi:hypothetical protein
MFDVELISNLVDSITVGKASGLDDLTSEHIKNSQPTIISILNRLFNFFISIGHIPVNFGANYTVPIPKYDGRTPRSMIS